MTFTTTATREELKSLNLPGTVDGTIFQVIITPISKEQAEAIAFKKLKGVAGVKLDLQSVREERLSEALN